MWKVEAYAEIPGDKPGTSCGGWQTIATVHHVATAERVAQNARVDRQETVRVRHAPGLTVVNRHGDICRIHADALTVAQELTPAEYEAELGAW